MDFQRTLGRDQESCCTEFEGYTGGVGSSHLKKRKKVRPSAEQWGPSHGCWLHGEPRKRLTLETHSTVRLDLGSFHGNGDAVQENDHQDDMIEHLVRDDFIAHQTESAEKKEENRGCAD